MRLIDADALKEEINLTSFWDQNDYGMVKNIIDNAPTADSGSIPDDKYKEEAAADEEEA